jgi:chromosome partitioning protein
MRACLHAGVQAGRDASERASQNPLIENLYQRRKETMTSTMTNGVVIAVGNQKGGVGKTTNAIHLAAALGEGGAECLIIDLDPAAGATKHLGVPQNSFAGSLELLTTDETVESLVLTDKMPKGVHLIPSRPQLSELETVISKFIDRTTVLEKPLALARQWYDFIFLDTPPSAAALTTVAAYSTAEWFVLSAFLHPLSLAGLTEAFNDIADVRKHRNRSLEVLGVVFTNVDRRATRLRHQLETVVNEALPGRKFQTSIPQAIILPELSGQGITLFQLPNASANPIANHYRRLAGELNHHVKNREAYLAGTLAPFGHDAIPPPRPAPSETQLDAVISVANE